MKEVEDAKKKKKAGIYHINTVPSLNENRAADLGDAKSRRTGLLSAESEYLLLWEGGHVRFLHGDIALFLVEHS